MVNLFEAMKEKNPKRNPINTAIDVLKKPEDIRLFMEGYEEYMLNSGEPSIRGREVEVARRNVGYMLGYYDEATRKRWYGVLKNVSHPIFGPSFGRGNDVTDSEAYQLGRKIGSALKKKG